MEKEGNKKNFSDHSDSTGPCQRGLAVTAADSRLILLCSSAVYGEVSWPIRGKIEKP